jgi:hypothetical protein
MLFKSKGDLGCGFETTVKAVFVLAHDIEFKTRCLGEAFHSGRPTCRGIGAFLFCLTIVVPSFAACFS